MNYPSLRYFLRLPREPHRSFSTSERMSSPGTADLLYSATISPASIIGAEPAEAKNKRHHLKNGQGFVNPWVRTTSQGTTMDMLTRVTLCVGKLERYASVHGLPLIIHPKVDMLTPKLYSSAITKAMVW